MFNLDDASLYERLDPSGLHHRIKELPAPCERAWLQAKDVSFPSDWRSFTEIIIVGMGGSAIAGNLAADLASPSSSPSIRVVRDFWIPGISKNSNQLIVACSFSGETKETVAMFGQALSEGVALAAIVGGGTLGKMAKDSGIPIMTVDSPGEPRSAVGCNLMLLGSLLDRVGAISLSDVEVTEAVDSATSMASQIGIGIPTVNNLAKQLARELIGGLTVVYGGGGLSAVALRWKSQINENGKSWAFAEVLPELLHNSVESFPGSPEIQERTTALLLKPYQTNTELGNQYEVLTVMLDQLGIKNRTFTGVSGGVLAQSLSMIVLGDHISYYMGILNGVNPSEAPIIDEAKNRLSNRE